MNLTLKNLPSLIREVTPAVNAYLIAEAHAEVVAEHVHEKIDRPLLDIYCFKNERTGAEITEAKNLYLAGDIDLTAFYKERDDEIAKQYPGITRGHCPALVAEGLARDAKRLVADIACKHLGGGLTSDKFICQGLEKYDRLVDLTVGLVVNRPGYKNPLTGKAVA